MYTYWKQMLAWLMCQPKHTSQLSAQPWALCVGDSSSPQPEASDLPRVIDCPLQGLHLGSDPPLHHHVILKSIKSDILLDWSHFLIAAIHRSLCSHSTSLTLFLSLCLSLKWQVLAFSFLVTRSVWGMCVSFKQPPVGTHSPFCAFLYRCQLYPANYPPLNELVSESEWERESERKTVRKNICLRVRSGWHSQRL